jgi:hypothetical protein
MTVKSADRKPEKYIGPDGKPRIRMVPVDKEIVKSEAKDGDGVNIVKDRPFKGKPMDRKPGKVGIKFSDMRKSKWAKDADANPKRAKAMGEAKDPEEYDKEGDMAKTQLKTMIDAAQELHDQLSDDENMPEWVQNKITKATDYIDSVRDYMKNNDDVNEETTEAVEIEELTAAEKKLVNQMYDKKGNLTPLGKKVMNHGKKPGDRGYTESLDEVLDRPGALDSYRKKAKMKSDKARNTATAKLLRGNPDISKEKETIRKREKGQDMADRVGVKQFRKSIGRGYVAKKEETVDEISKGLAGRYIKKAQVSTADAAKSTERGHTDSRSPDRDIAKAGSSQAKKGIKTFINRNKGTSTAVDKLTGKARVPAKEDTVSEISNNKMGQYVRKAADDAARQASKGDAKGIVKARQRVKGVSKAMDKIDKNRLYGRQ